MQYTTGLVSTTAASAVVTGNGTAWLAEAEAGDLLIVNGGNVPYTIASVESDTQLTLTAPFPTTETDVPYSISRDFTPFVGLPEVPKRAIDAATLITRSFRKIDSQFQNGVTLHGLLNAIANLSTNGFIKKTGAVTAEAVSHFAEIPLSEGGAYKLRLEITGDRGDLIFTYNGQDKFRISGGGSGPTEVVPLVGLDFDIGTTSDPIDALFTNILQSFEYTAIGKSQPLNENFTLLEFASGSVSPGPGYIWWNAAAQRFEIRWDDLSGVDFKLGALESTGGVNVAAAAWKCPSLWSTNFLYAADGRPTVNQGTTRGMYLKLIEPPGSTVSRVRVTWVGTGDGTAGISDRLSLRIRRLDNNGFSGVTIADWVHRYHGGSNSNRVEVFDFDDFTILDGWEYWLEFEGQAVSATGIRFATCMYETTNRKV